MDGTDVTVSCAVEMAQGVVDSDLSLIMVDAQLSRDGTPLTLTGPTVTGTTFTYTIQLDSFGRNDSGNYTCSATVTRVQPTSTYLTGSGQATTVVEIVVGKNFKKILHVKAQLDPCMHAYCRWQFSLKVHSKKHRVKLTQFGLPQLHHEIS